MTPEQLLQWNAVLSSLFTLGVRSISVIHGLLQDAGADDAAIADLTAKWDALRDDVARAAADPEPPTLTD